MGCSDGGCSSSAVTKPRDVLDEHAFPGLLLAEDRFERISDVEGTEGVAVAVTGLAPDRFRAVVAAIMRPTVLPVGKGSKTPSPDRLVPNYIDG